MFHRLHNHFRRTRYPLLDAMLTALMVIAGVEMLVSIARFLD
jgi:hypothetical protein